MAKMRATRERSVSSVVEESLGLRLEREDVRKGRATAAHLE